MSEPTNNPHRDRQRLISSAPPRRIYIAGPYTFAAPGVLATPQERLENVKRAARVADLLRREGWTPFVPHAHYSAWSEAMGGGVFAGVAGHDEVMTQCLRWVEICDAILRLPGYSPGSDVEVLHARIEGLKTYELSDMPDLIAQSGASG